MYYVGGSSLTRKNAAITGAVLFLAGLLVGFFPQYQRASRLAAELKSARLDGKLSQIRELASLSYVDASRMNYGSATEHSERMFSLAQEVAADAKDNEPLRSSLNRLLTFHDTVKRKLSSADATVLETLQQIVQKTQTELKPA